MQLRTVTENLEQYNTEKMQQLLVEMYGQEQVKYQLDRYQQLMNNYHQQFGDGNIQLFSSPGRSEIGGNHTDHNYGKVLATSINLDTISAAVPVDEPYITIVSEGYSDVYKIHTSELEPVAGEGGTLALIRGIVAGFVQWGLHVGGFNAYVSTNVLAASGLSSSASFEMLITSILNTFYNDSQVDIVNMARIGQYAENQFWNKPSGLLDQMACAHGGLIAIDFVNPKEPAIQHVPYDFNAQGYEMVIVNTGGNHADLTADYAAVPQEMKAVAEALGHEVCRQITEEEIYTNLVRLREQTGDRAILRALHFLEENDRVDEQVKALQSNEWDHFLTLITGSGNSSWKWLQNVYQDSHTREQSISIALAITEIFLKQKQAGACRVHGGGFAGVILTILPKELVSEYTALIEQTLGTSTYIINVRQHGSICLNQYLA